MTINDLVSIIKQGDCPDCWMRSDERAAAALEGFFAENRRAALIDDGGIGARLLLEWGDKSGCEVRAYAVGRTDTDIASAKESARADGYELVIDGVCAGQSGIAALRAGVSSPLMRLGITGQDALALLKSLHDAAERDADSR